LVAGASGSVSGWPVGGRAVKSPETLDRDWTYGTMADAAVRESVDASKARPDKGRGRALVIGCGALARELVAVTERIPGLDVTCLAPDLHNRPDGIPAAVRDRIRRARADGYERIFVAYADCGTGGLLEPVLAEAGVERLPGAHCYEVFAGGANFAHMADAEPGTFWLTDFLARNFERLVIRGLGIDRHPDLLDVYFANYRRVVYLSQTDDPDLLATAGRAADRLGLAFEHRHTGIGGLRAPIEAFAAGGVSAGVPATGAAGVAATGAGGVPPKARDCRGAGVSNTFAPSRPRSRPESVATSRRARSIDPNEADRVRYARGARTARPAGGGGPSPPGRPPRPPAT